MRQLQTKKPFVDQTGCRGTTSSLRLPLSQHQQSMLSNNLYTCCDAQFTQSGEVSLPAGPEQRGVSVPRAKWQGLYSADEKRRRDSTPWTLVQGILAPFQFLVFLPSLALVLRYLATGEGLALATASVLLKTATLYAIMITGAIWERVVFGRYLFAPAFFWEDVFSIAVIALHTAYVAAIIKDIGTPLQQMVLVLAAYAAYAINATQFLLKLRAARLQDRALHSDDLAAEPVA